MRARLIFALALVSSALVAGDALAFGKKLRSSEGQGVAPDIGRRGGYTIDSPKPTPYGYIIGPTYPAYTTPHGYNQILFPSFNPIPPLNARPTPPTTPATEEGEK